MSNQLNESHLCGRWIFRGVLQRATSTINALDDVKLQYEYYRSENTILV